MLWAPSQYPKRRLSVRSRKVSKPRDLYLELSDRSEIWHALRQQCCRCACQISKRYDNSILYEILRKDVFSDIETGSRFRASRGAISYQGIDIAEQMGPCPPRGRMQAIWRRLNIKMLSYPHRHCHCKDKRVSRPCYSYNGNIHTWKDGIYIETPS